MRLASSSEELSTQEALAPQRSVSPYDQKFRRRLQVLMGAILVAFALLLVRTWTLQVWRGEHFLHLADNNRLRNLRIKSLRGKVSGRAGHVLADNRPSYTLMALPEDLPSPLPAPLLEQLRAHTIEVAPEVLSTRQAAAASQPVVIQRNLSRDQVAYFAERRMDFPGFFIEVDPLRVYPYGMVAAHLLGYIGEISAPQLQRAKEQGYSQGDVIGQYGLERAYEPMLRGTSGWRRVEVNVLGQEIRLLETKQPTSGKDLLLTLDLQLQQLAETLLHKGQHTGSIVALDPRNGQILALASRPAFDPNLLASRPSVAEWQALQNHPDHPLHHRATQAQYPPGSVFKIVTAVAALAEGVATTRTTVCCRGHYTYGGHTYRDWTARGHGCVQLRQALAQSCDVYFYHIGQLLGVDRIAHYARAFGLGQVTGFAPGLDRSGLMPTRQWKQQVRKQPWFAGETLPVAIGQGYVLTTPLQVANMVATLANGGTRYKPYVVLRQVEPDGTKLPETTPVVVQHLDVPASYMTAVQQGLWSVVNDGRGTGKRARHPRIAIAGKTGTAQVISTGGRGRRSQSLLPKAHRNHAWFAAYAPFDAPRIAVVVMLENAGRSGGEFGSYAKILIQAYVTGNYTLPTSTLTGKPKRPRGPARQPRRVVARPTVKPQRTTAP